MLTIEPFIQSTNFYFADIPAAVSLPHFLDADPSLLEDVEGLHPDEAKHRTSIILQPVRKLTQFKG